MMKYAETINDITNAFKHGPLEEDELQEFYCGETMEIRTGYKHESPIQDITDACKIPSLRNSFLLLGHRGCGKSTELNKMSADLKEEGYYVRTVECGMELNMTNLLHSDLLILMGEVLIRIADEVDCHLSDELINNINDFWASDIEKIKTITKVNELSAEAGIEAKSPRFVKVVNLFAILKTNLRLNETQGEIHRTKMINRSSDWLRMLNRISDDITKKLNGKQPIIIFEDLDKIDAEVAWKIFSNYSYTLTDVSFPVIYTFPIALCYSTKFTALDGYFTTTTLPMIKLENSDGSKNDDGIDVIKEIVKKRTELNLFEADVLEKMIKKTGGSLRDLFFVISAAAQRTMRRKSGAISSEDADIALVKLKSSLTRRIEEKHYKFLSNIYNGDRKQIKDKEMLLDMLQANVVLEYDNDRWHNLHPLIAEFLTEQGLTNG